MFDPEQLDDPEFRSRVQAARALIAERVRRGVATPAEHLAVVDLARTTAMTARRCTDVDCGWRAAGCARLGSEVLRHRPASRRSVDVPHRVSSDARPTRAEWAVTRASTPAGRAERPGTAAPPSAARAAPRGPWAPDSPAARSVPGRRRRPPSRFVFPRRTVTPSPGDRLGDVAPEEAAHLAALHPPP